MYIAKGELVNERYEIQEIIGKGGMAIVYKAYDMKLDRVVTLKVLREEYNKDDEFIERFSIEAKAAAKLNHRNIVSIYDVGEYKNINYIVMEYIEGVTLKDIIKAKGKFNNDEVLGVAIQIAEALEVAHKNGIVHRDIKPQNILVTTKGDVKVTDFGIARAVDANTMTAANNTMGSVHYFSPEQARGGYIDQKSDIYSLGISTYEMITGELPFDDDTVVAIALKHINEELPDIKSRNPYVMDELINIVKKATEKTTTMRYETIDEMTIELKKALAKINKDEGVNTRLDSRTSTTLINEEDLDEIRSKAMTAFFDEEDLEQINENYFKFDDDEPKKDKGKIFVFLGALLAIILAAVVAMSIYNVFRGDAVEEVDVPILTGMTITEARQEAASVGVSVEEYSQQFDDEVPEGEIIEQDYQEGDILYEGDTIRVITSLGSDKIEVPDVTGLIINDAYDVFTEYPFEVVEDYEYNDDVEQNVIYDQDPAAGEMAESGETVVLTISRGEKVDQVTVPSLSNMPESTAISRIDSVGLEYGGSTYSHSSSVPEGYVVAQTLTPGTTTLEGTSVSLVVSSGPEEEVIEEPVETEEPSEESEATEEAVESDEPSEEPETTEEAVESDEPSEEVEATEEAIESEEPVEPSEEIEEPVVTEEATEEPVAPTEEASTTSSKTLTLNPVLGTEDPVNMQVVNVETGQDVYNGMVTQSQLPVTITVTGQDVVRYNMYIDGVLIGNQLVDFSQ